ncbi:LOW QUALITY PROTEIN: hypothetical protein HID58_070702 [Brassica napus]|uniref:Uncharacterized protein n=1 Tax=Brassica napus TaxID=3708 RepID=A0ABQ7YZK4_BRANA|nr:LOW QUALITY PROTEIN: hypothetical protein HID58_070702 [Brassica napus]
MHIRLNLVLIASFVCLSVRLCLSVALVDGGRGLTRWLSSYGSGRDQMAIDMFCGKRHEEESSNKGLQLLLRRGALASLVSFKRVALASLGLFVVVLYHGHD